MKVKELKQILSGLGPDEDDYDAVMVIDGYSVEHPDKISSTISHLYIQNNKLLLKGQQ